MFYRFRFLLFIFFCTRLVWAQIPQPAFNLAFIQSEVATVHIDIDPDSLNLLLGDSLYAGHEFMATVSYQSSLLNQTIDSIGFRARGNTSLASQKNHLKSISIGSFQVRSFKVWKKSI